MEISTNQQLPGRGFFQKKLVAFVWGRIGKKPSYSTVGFDVSFPMNQWKWDLLTCLPTILNIHSGSSKKKSWCASHHRCSVFGKEAISKPRSPNDPNAPIGLVLLTYRSLVLVRYPRKQLAINTWAWQTDPDSHSWLMDGLFPPVGNT